LRASRLDPTLDAPNIGHPFGSVKTLVVAEKGATSKKLEICGLASDSNIAYPGTLSLHFQSTA
jgi:hypothetical protein